jgi:hypothetical protein
VTWDDAVVSPQPTRSQLLLARLHALPRLTVPALVLVLTVAGLLAPPLIGVPCLVVLALFLGWLASLAWPRLDQPGRLLRALVVGLLVGAAIARATGALD